MRIIELTEKQFDNYSKIHSARNYALTTQYALMEKDKHNYQIRYLGLIDNNNNLYAASLILESELKGNYKMGFAYSGFLIDYTDYELFAIFTEELKKYLKKLNYIYLKTNPLIKYKISDENNNIIHYESNLIDRLSKLGYQHLGFTNEFSRYNVILKTPSDINKTYQKFNRNTKRNINKANQMAITIHKGNTNNIELFYSLVRKKFNKPLDYYKDYFKYFNNDHNKSELYFSKINPIEYLNNYRYLLDKEQKNNWMLQEKLENNINNNNIINKKMVSDELIDSYQKEIKRATLIYQKFPNGLVVGTSLILKNDREIYFLEDGYEDKLKDIHSLHKLKWEIIKKYLNEGYQIFNLGQISPNKNKEDNKYYGLYLSKIGFNSQVIEYPGDFNLIINKTLYNIYLKISKIKKH